MSRAIFKENVKTSVELADIYHRLLEIIWTCENEDKVSENTMDRLLDLATQVQENLGTLVLTRTVNER